MRSVITLLAAGVLSVSASAGINSQDLSQWLPELPPFTHAPRADRGRHLEKWLPHVRPTMSVAQVLVMLGHPDWGVTTRGKARWLVNPKSGVLRYSAGYRDGSKGLDRVIHIHFDEEARVKRIVDNGVITATGPRVLLPGPLPTGVPWRP